MIGLALAFGIVLLIICAILAVNTYPWLYCVLHGHTPCCSIKECGVIKYTCTHCNQEVDVG